MTSIDLKQNAAALECLASDPRYEHIKELFEQIAKYLREQVPHDSELERCNQLKNENKRIKELEDELATFHAAMERERKGDWEKYVKSHADFLEVRSNDTAMQPWIREKFKAASILLNEMWQCFTHKANFVPYKLWQKEANRLLIACLDTGGIRTDSTRQLWDDIHKWLKDTTDFNQRIEAAQLDAKAELKSRQEYQGEANREEKRIKELEAESLTLLTNQAELKSRLAEALAQNIALRKEAERLRADLMNPPPEIEELVIRKLDLISCKSLDRANAEIAQLRQDRDHLDEQHRSLLAEKNQAQATCSKFAAKIQALESEPTRVKLQMASSALHVAKEKITALEREIAQLVQDRRESCDFVSQQHDKIQALETEVKEQDEIINHLRSIIPTTAQIMVYGTLLRKYKALETRLERARELLKDCLTTGAIRTDTTRILWVEVNDFLAASANERIK